MPRSAIIIGTSATIAQVQRQLALVDHPPRIVAAVLATDDSGAIANAHLDGGLPTTTLDALETFIERYGPAVAIVSLPAVMTDLVTTIRTKLRRLGLADRFMPTLEDQLAGVGPRTHWDIDTQQLLDRPPRAIDAAAIRRVIDGRRVLITGAGGSIGSELARMAVCYHPSEIILIDRSENALFEVDRQIARLNPDITRRALLHDIVDADGTAQHFAEIKPDVVFHAAAHKHVPMMESHPAAAIDNNFFGTKSVADAAHTAGVSQLVMISTDKAVNPASVMGATKRLAELYVQHINSQSDTAFSMVRFGNVLGSSGSVLEVWAHQLAEGGPISVTHPDMTRYFMTIPEAASLVIQSAALVHPGRASGEVFLLDMGAPVRILDMAKRFIALHGLESKMDGDTTTPDSAATIRIITTGPRPGEKLFEELAFDAEAMRPTRHPEINIWQMPTPQPQHIEMICQALAADQRPQEAGELVRTVRDLIPEMSQPLPTTNDAPARIIEIQPPQVRALAS